MKINNTLELIFADDDEIELALIVGSRARGTAGEDSDWDFAIQWHKVIPYLDTLGKTEVLRNKLATLTGFPAQKIDIIDMPTSRLAMRAEIADAGILLKGGIGWNHFLLRTWRKLEEMEWEKKHAI